MQSAAVAGVGSYRKVEIESRTSLELVVMLYNAALQSLEQAADAVARRDIRARQAAISRTMAIVSQLQNTLDMDRGQPIAQSLDDLYGYVLGLLLDATSRQETAPLEEARRILTTLNEGWSAIASAQPIKTT